MNTEFTLGALQLQLHRWPLNQPNHSLQAWDAADELILTRAIPVLAALKQAATTPPRVLIINDAFGALSCGLGQGPQFLMQDSVIAKLACRHNRLQNQLNDTDIQELASLAPWPQAPDLVLLKIPTNHSYLAYLLAKLQQVITPQTQLVIAAKAKDITKQVLALFSQFLGPSSASLTEKKCRYIEVNISPQAANTEAVNNATAPLRWTMEDSGFTLVNYPNVFSREKLDIGARFFLTHLPTVATNSLVVDLGCGNGVLSLQLLQQQPACRVLLCDDSYFAIASAQASISENMPQHLAQCTFRADDCLSQQADNSVDWVICNPPFHQQNAVTTHIASQMFRDAKRVLKTGGRLRIIANRHLPYQQQLKKLFGHCQQLAANPKFVILESIKRS